MNTAVIANQDDVIDCGKALDDIAGMLVDHLHGLYQLLGGKAWSCYRNLLVLHWGHYLISATQSHGTGSTS